MRLSVAWQDYNGNEAFSKVVLPHTVRGRHNTLIREKAEQMEPVCLCHRATASTAFLYYNKINTVCFKPDVFQIIIMLACKHILNTVKMNYMGY